MTQEEVMGKRRLVVGVDPTAESLDALRLGALIAGGLRAAVHVVAVLPGGLAGPGVDPADERVREYFDGLFEIAGAELGGEFTEHRVIGVSAPAGLTAAAEELDAAAVVIGSSAHGPIGRVLMGDVGATLAAGSHCAVLVAPRGYERECPERIERVGIGYNGSPESVQALEYGVEAGRDLGVPVTLIGAVPLVHVGGRIGHTSRGYQRLISEEMEDRLAEAAARCGEGVSYEVRTGDAADCLAEASAEVDLLILSSRGYGPLRRVMMGGVSVRVMRSAACPVMVLPRAHDAA